ncbi:MAG: DUF6433 family protein [Ilumatobacteraceae bacterium]
MAMKLQISEILSKLKDFTGEGAVAKKVEWLRQNDSTTLRLMLKHAFDASIAYNLPEGDPPFTPNKNQIDQTETTLFAETRKLGYLWLQASDSALEDLTQTQRTQLEELEAQQEEKGKELQEMIAAYRAAEQEITDAREAIEQAKVRLNKAIERAKTLQKEGQEFNAKVEQLNRYVGNVRQSMLGANAELMNRSTPDQHRNVPKYRLEMQFIQLLESLHPDEAKVLLGAKNKTLNKAFPITKDLVKKAFPDLL